MKIAVITKYSNEYRSFGRYSAANVASYCRMHGYDFIVDHVPPDKTRPMSYSKFEAILRYLDKYDWIVWSDADTIIMDFNKRLEDFIDNQFHFVAGKFIKGDGIEYFHTGFFFIKSSGLSKVLINSVLNAKEYYTDYKREEEAIRQISPEIPGLNIKFIPIGEVCSIPVCNYHIPGFEVHRGNAPAYDTHKFILHATMFPTMKQRIEFVTDVVYNNFDVRNSIPRLMTPDNYRLLEIFIQTTTLCNAKCITCPHEEVYKKDNYTMFNDLWDKIIADLYSMLFTGIVSLTYNYEPFMDRRIHQQIKDLREKTLGCVAITSNCSKITDLDLSFLKDNPPDMFLCSMISPYRDEYEYRTGLDYDIVMKNIIDLHDNIPNVQINCSVSTKEEADEFRRIFDGRNIILTGLDSRAGLKPNFQNSYPSNFFQGRGCVMPFKTMAIRADGKVPICCLDWGMNTTLAGDLNDQTIMEVFNGPVFSYFRKNRFEMKYHGSACTACAKEFGYAR